jgi:hypothetical protein
MGRQIIYRFGDLRRLLGVDANAAIISFYDFPPEGKFEAITGRPALIYSNILFGWAFI